MWWSGLGSEGGGGGGGGSISGGEGVRCTLLCLRATHEVAATCSDRQVVSAVCKSGVRQGVASRRSAAAGCDRSPCRRGAPLTWAGSQRWGAREARERLAWRGVVAGAPRGGGSGQGEGRRARPRVMRAWRRSSAEGAVWTAGCGDVVVEVAAASCVWEVGSGLGWALVTTGSQRRLQRVKATTRAAATSVTGRGHQQHRRRGRR